MHEQTTVKIDGKNVEIDSELAPLILEMNKIGIKTKYSCRGGDDFDILKRAYISIDMSGVRVDFSDDVMNLRWKLKE